MDKLKVLVIDSKDRICIGINQILSENPAFELIEYGPSSDPLVVIDDNSPDIVLMSTQRKQNWLELTRHIVRYYPNTKVILVSPSTNDEHIFGIIKTGAVACINTNNIVSELIDTMMLANQGKYPINEAIINSMQLAGLVLMHFHETEYLVKMGDEIVTPLNKQETQVLSYIAEGKTKKEIASLLQISEQNIEKHISAILRKMNANDRVLEMFKATSRVVL